MKERIDKALSIAWKYGQIDGTQHKMWVIDQIVKALCGSKSEYKMWVETYETLLTNGENYKWDTGIAP